MDIRKMDLHDTTWANPSDDMLVTYILKVMGGWVYTTIDKSNGIGSSVFVPFKEN